MMQKSFSAEESEIQTLEQVYTIKVIQLQSSGEHVDGSSVACCRKYNRGGISCIS